MPLEAVSPYFRYWRTIVAAADCLDAVPKNHSWTPEDYYDPDPTAPDKTYSKRGAVLGEVPFDCMRFGMLPSY